MKPWKVQKPYRDKEKPTAEFLQELCRLTAPPHNYRTIARHPKFVDLKNSEGEIVRLYISGKLYEPV